MQLKLNRQRLQHLEELAARHEAEWEGCRGAADKARQAMFEAQGNLERFQDAASRSSAPPQFTTTILPGGGAVRTKDLNRLGDDQHAAGAPGRELARLEKAYADTREAYQRAGQRLSEAVARRAATDTLLTRCRRYLEDNGIRL